LKSFVDLSRRVVAFTPRKPSKAPLATCARAPGIGADEKRLGPVAKGLSGLNLGNIPSPPHEMARLNPRRKRSVAYGKIAKSRPSRSSQPSGRHRTRRWLPSSTRPPDPRKRTYGAGSKPSVRVS
jgi:hypothetical protein